MNFDPIYGIRFFYANVNMIAKKWIKQLLCQLTHCYRISWYFSFSLPTHFSTIFNSPETDNVYNIYVFIRLYLCNVCNKPNSQRNHKIISLDVWQWDNKWIWWTTVELQAREFIDRKCTSYIVDDEWFTVSCSNVHWTMLYSLWICSILLKYISETVKLNHFTCISFQPIRLRSQAQRNNGMKIYFIIIRFNGPFNKWNSNEFLQNINDSTRKILYNERLK